MVKTLRLVIFFTGITIVFFTLSGLSLADTIPDPCNGLLNLVNRPTKSDSPCVVRSKQAVLEVGYQYLNLHGGGSAQNFPEAEIRIGLPLGNEVIAVPPNYNHQTIRPRAGYNATVVGFKHGFGYNAHWVGSIEALLGLPNGGSAFGSNQYQPLINGIVQYTFNPALSLTFMLGVGSQSIPPSAGGQSYFTVNPDLVLTWQVNDKLQTFGEVYGQSKTAPGKGAGFNMGAGVLFLLRPYLEVDAELGQRISGKLQGFNNFFGVGMSVLFS